MSAKGPPVKPTTLATLAMFMAATFSLGASAQTMAEQLQAMRAEQNRIKAEEDSKNRQLLAEQEAKKRAAQERDRERQEQLAKAEKERQQQNYELERKRIAASQVIEKERLALIREQQARADKDRARARAYEDEQRRLDLVERKADIAMRRARADRSNDFIDRELSREDAKNNVINSNADANRNISEGGRDMLKGIGKGVERHGLGK